MQMFSTKTREWFLSSVGTPTEAQRMGWQAISEGRDALISSPTGSGKTLAAFLYFLDEMRRELDAGALAEGLRIVYVSPLKALGNDIRQNLERPLAGLGLSDAVRVAVRTGDTDAKARREMIKHPPHILITTPESLYLLLTSLSGRDMLKTARTVIVDELHAVLSSKRGAHLFLSLARLDALCGGHVRRVGLSATVNPPEEAARHLTGGEPCAVIVPKIEKRTELTVDVPVPDMRQLPERSVWPAIADRVIEALDHVRTVLVFVDGRAGCERLALRINERAGQTLARTHHGCVSKEQRLEAERMLKSGELRVMVATSSMELGVDVGEIDLVVQVGPPPGVSALLQRLGRAGHNPSRVSRMRVYPRTAAEAIGCALVCEAAREGRIERVRAPEMCLDVLSQHLVSMAAAGAYTVDEAVEILSRAYAYRRLASEDVKAVLGMLSGDYERMDDRPVKPRVVYDRLSGRVSGDAYTRMLALSAGGTIPDRGWFAVTLPDGTRLGELDEEFVFEARLGDKFYLGAFPWKIEEITRDRVIVSPTSPEGAASPFWKGDRAARAYETGAFYGSLLSKWEDAARRSPAALRAALCAAGLTPDAAENAARVLESQLRAVGCLATDRVLVAEHFSDEAGEHQLMLHSPFGDAVNRALGMLLARRAAAATGEDARAYDDDDGALICLVGGQPIPDALLPTLAATSAPDIYPVPITPNTVSNTSSRDASGAQLAFDNPAAASGARFTFINPDTAPGANCVSANANAASGARFTSINPDTKPDARHVPASANAASGAQLAFDNPVAASGARFTSINPDNAPSASLVPASANAASGAQLAFDNPVAASGAHCTSTNPDTASDADCVSASANAASGAQLAFDNPVAASGARFTSTNPDTKPGANCVSASRNAVSAARFTSINSDTKPGANCASASTNAASGAQLAFDNPAAASGARFTSINPDTKPGAQLAFDNPVAASGARFTSINPETRPGANCASTSANAVSSAQLVFDNPVTASGARFTSINPETKPGASPVPASANAASGVQLAFDDPVAASGARFTSINPETYPGASPVPASANAASGAQLAFDNPAAASGARFTSINPDTAPDVSHVPASANAASGAQLAFDSPVAPVAASGASRVPASANTALGAQVTPDNPVTASGESHVSTSANAASGARFTFTNPVAASGARFTSTNPDTAPGAQLASADPNAALGSRLASVTPDATSVPLCGAAAEVRAMLPASPMFSMAFRYNVQRALLNGVRGGRRQPLWVQRLRGAEALGAAAAHPEHPMMRETLNECADGYLDLNALTRLLSAIRAGQVRVYEVHTDAPSPLCLNLRRQVEAEMMYDTAIPSAAVTLSKEALLTLAPTEEAVKSASRPARAPRNADELHARLLSEGDLLAGEACAPAEWMDALEIAGRAVYIEPGLWIARENEDEYRLALEENDAAALSRVVRRTARFHGSQTAETLSERYAVDEVRAQEALNTLCSEGILREFGGAYVHAELYESAQRMTVALNRQRVETQPARAFARMLSQRVRGAGSSAAQLAQALVSLRGCAYPAAAWEGYLLPARVANYRPQLLDEALARGEAAYRVLPAECPQLPSETRAQAAARPYGAASSDARISVDGSQLLGEAVVRDEAAEYPQLSNETRAQAAARPCGAAPSSARASVDGSRLLSEAAECPQLPSETRAQAAARPRGAAPSGARISVDGSQLLGEATERDEAAERPQLPGETRAQAAARPCGAAPSSARVSIDGSRLPGEAAVHDEAAEHPQLSGEPRAQAAARPRDAAPSSARASIDGSQLPGEATERDEAAERPQLPGETRAQAAARPRGAAPSGARVSIDGSQLLGEATERPQLPGETRAQAAARPRGAAPSSARVSIDGSRLLGETVVRDEAAEHPQLSGEPRAQAATRTRGAAPSSARVSIDGSQLPGEAAVRDEAAECPQLSGEPRAQAAARPRGAAPSSVRVSIDGSQLLGEATERDEAAERPRLPGETRAQAAARPRGAAPSGARVSIDGSWLPGEAAERPQLPGETRAQAAARPYGAAPSGARVSIDVSQFPGEAAVRDEAAYRVLPAERSRLPNETRAQAAARARDAAPSDARVSIDGSQLPGEAAVRDEAAYRVLPAERPQLPGETAVRVLSGERSQLSGETAARVQSGETADSRSIPAPEIDGVPANPLAASRVRGSAASAFELHAQRRGTAVLDQSGSAHPESGLRDGRAIFGERTRASRAASGERVRVQFDLPDDEGEYEPLPDDLTDMERDVLQTLTARGASFASRLPVNAGDALKSLLARGLVRADSFLPVREMLATESGNVKKTVRRRVRVMDAGRWSRVGVLPQTSAEALVERLFDRFGIVCRETAGADWNAAFGVLKHMEYAGKARRGYFVKGLSGAQFMRETDYSTITAQLRQPSGECVWLPAADPMQAWGAYLAHEEGRAFLRVPGAAVALMDGAVVAVSEKQGETLRVFDDPAAPEALRALADAFRRGAIFPTLPRLLIKKYPPTAAAHLEAAGFTREMLDYTLMRRG